MYNILFVDDDDTMGFIFSRMKLFKESNFTIKKQARNGKEALDILKNDEFDVIITDIRMPIIDGLELLEILRSEGNNIPLILASTYSEFEYAKRGLQSGAMDYIIKPFEEESLGKTLDKVEQLLDKINSNENIISQKVIEDIYNNLLINEEYKGIQSILIYEKEYLSDDNLKRGAIEIQNKIISLFLEKFPWLKKLEQSKFLKDYKGNLDNLFKNLKEIILTYKLYKHNNITNKITNILVDNIHNDKAIDKASNELELSKEYLGRLLKSELDVTIKEYLTILRMEYAKELIKSTNMKMYKICEDVGYKTIDYFTKLFKNYTGYTPMQYKKIIK